MGNMQTAGIDTITIGGRVFTNLSALIFLAAYSSNAGTNVRATFRKSTASAGYQVTTAKTLTVEAIRIVPKGFSANDQVFLTNLLQSDNDAGLDGTTAFTNPVYFGGTVNWGNIAHINTTATAGAEKFSENLGWGRTVAATKYLSCIFGGAADGINAFVLATEA